MNITVNKKRACGFAAIVIIQYILLAVSLVSSNSNSINDIIYCALMPIVILILGSCDFDIKKRTKTIVGVCWFLFTPDYIIRNILRNGDIIFLESQLYNVALLLILTIVFITIVMRTDLAIIATALICLVLFVANDLVMAFRGTPIIPADFFALQTAAAVSGEYKFFVSTAMVSSFDFFVLLVMISLKLCLRPQNRMWLYRICSFSAVVISCCIIAKVDKVMDRQNLKYYTFATEASNDGFGVVGTMYVNIKQSFLSKPEEYKTELAEEILAQSSNNTAVSNDNAVRPNVVVIMNEAFSDYAKTNDIKPTEDPLPYWHSLTDNTISGDLVVPVFGGGTSYTEFEFLSGLGGGIFGTQYNCYLKGIHDDTYSLAWDLKQLGYKNIAIHPFWGVGWNRDKVYPRLGFDDFISGEVISGKHATSNDEGTLVESTDLGDDIDYVRNYASDKESFNLIKEQFENKQPDEKLFVFNVTIQNHGGYNYDGDNFEYKVMQENDKSKTDVNQYLSLLKYTDEAYQELIEYFKTYDEPTVVLMFGDHQPQIISSGPSQEYAYLDEFMFQYLTDYKIWANFPLNQDVEDGAIGANLLSLKLKQAVGLPLNEWDNFRTKLNKHFLGVSLYGCTQCSDDKIVFNGNLNDEEEQLLEDYKMLEYYLFFEQGLLKNKQ